MASSALPTLNEVRRKGLEALLRELGPVGMVRFLQQFEPGHGDYTKQRHEWLGEAGVRDVAARIRSWRRS